MPRSLQSSCRSILASLHSHSCKSSTLVPPGCPTAPCWQSQPNHREHSGVVQDVIVQGGEHSHPPLQKTYTVLLSGHSLGLLPQGRAWDTVYLLFPPTPISPAPGAVSSVCQSTCAHEGVSMGRSGSKRQQTQPTAPASTAQLTQGADGDTLA